MKKLKVVTVVGTRPEIIRLSRLIPKFDLYTDHVLVHTGQNSDKQLNEVFFQDFGLRQPDYFLNVDTSSIAGVLADVMLKTEAVFIKEKPDAVMILGDTNSAIAAVVAERMHIPVYHMEAGNRSWDANVPEELNRKLVDHVATFNLPYSDHALRNLLAEGIHPRFIQKTGSPIREVFLHYRSRIEASSVLDSLGLKKNGYFLVSIHRQETVNSPTRLARVIDSLKEVHEQFGLPMLISTHPRTKEKLGKLVCTSTPGFLFHEPFGYLDYNKLQLGAKCVISDSGSVAEEALIMGFNAVTLRDSMERPEALEVGGLSLVGVNSTASLLSRLRLPATPASSIPPGYEVTDFSDRVLSFVLSTAELAMKWRGLNAPSADL